MLLPDFLPASADGGVTEVTIDRVDKRRAPRAVDAIKSADDAGPVEAIADAIRDRKSVV